MAKKHLYKLSLGGISIYIQGVSERHFSAYIPNNDGGIELRNIEKVDVPLDEDMWNEINEIICSK
mgnify:CR=1 FL=1